MYNLKIIYRGLVILILLSFPILVLSQGASAFHIDSLSVHDVGIVEIVQPSGTTQRLSPHQDEWIHFDDGIFKTGIGISGGGTFEGAIRITPKELTLPGQLTAVRFYHYVRPGYNTSHSGTIKIYGNGTEIIPGPLLFSQPYTVDSPDGGAWEEIPLFSVVPVNSKEDLWVSIEITHDSGEYPLGMDKGPAVHGKGDWIRLGANWRELYKSPYYIDRNWNIWAKIEPAEQGSPGSYAVEAIIGNYGTDNETFNVTATIRLLENTSPFYTDTILVSNLSINSSTTAFFQNVTFDEEGVYVINIFTNLSIDENPTNDQQNKVFIIRIPDTTPPVTTHLITGTKGDNEWYITNVTIVLSAEDRYEPSGVEYTYYKLYEEDEWNIYYDSINISKDDYYNLSYYSVDYAGNIEGIKGPFLIKVDQTPPTINLTIKHMIVKWVFIAQVSDVSSGINKVVFYLDNILLGEITETPYEWTWMGTGSHSVKAISYDNAGNSKVSDVIPVSVDLSSKCVINNQVLLLGNLASKS